MKSLYFSHYFFYRSDLPEQKILAISDIHFSGPITPNQSRTLNFAKHTNPDLIVITGDIINNTHVLENDENKKVIREWFAELGKVAPVFVSLGNHDFFREAESPVKVGRRKYRYEYVEKSPLIKCLADIKNIHILDGSASYTEHSFVFGLSLPTDYYDAPSHSGQEKKESLLKSLDEHIENLRNLPPDKAKILLVHSPTFLTDPDIKARLSEFDLVFAGHMHNGMVPPVLQEIWRGRRGVITATKSFFKNQNTRLGLYGDKLIVLGAVNATPQKLRIHKVLDAFFPANAALVEISHKKPDGTKPSVKRRYKTPGNPALYRPSTKSR